MSEDVKSVSQVWHQHKNTTSFLNYTPTYKFGHGMERGLVIIQVIAVAQMFF